MAKQEKVYWPESEETNIVPVEIVDEIKGSMLQYGMSVLVGRALPDVRDGLKPVHRRILYSFFNDAATTGIYPRHVSLSLHGAAPVSFLVLRACRLTGCFGVNYPL